MIEDYFYSSILQPAQTTTLIVDKKGLVKSLNTSVKASYQVAQTTPRILFMRSIY